MASDFAIIQTGGKQYKVSAGQKIRVEKLDTQSAAEFSFDKVLLRSVGGAVTIGTPHVANAAVKAKVLGDVRGRKEIVFKYHSKTRQRKKKGHKQNYTEFEISSI